MNIEVVGPTAAVVVDVAGMSGMTTDQVGDFFVGWFVSAFLAMGRGRMQAQNKADQESMSRFSVGYRAPTPLAVEVREDVAGTAAVVAESMESPVSRFVAFAMDCAAVRCLLYGVPAVAREFEENALYLEGQGVLSVDWSGLRADRETNGG
ncbi:MAG: hypothetical protein C0483_03415 [Pirellula sp.]|nr:hypothetical protein [Pirellula sp.]